MTEKEAHLEIQSGKYRLHVYEGRHEILDETYERPFDAYLELKNQGIDPFHPSDVAYTADLVLLYWNEGE